MTRSRKYFQESDKASQQWDLKKVTPHNASQRYFMKAIEDKNNSYVFGVGPCGTGKSLLAIYQGVKMLQEGFVDRIIFIRANVFVEEEQSIGAIPGSLEEKYAPHFAPILDNLRELGLNKTYVENLIENDLLELLPVQWCRGRSFGRCVVGDTEVTMQDGTREFIKYIKIGDELLSVNNVTGKYESKRVLATSSRFSDKGTYKIACSQGTTIELTPEHEMYMVDSISKQIVKRAANQLNVGDTLLSMRDYDPNRKIPRFLSDQSEYLQNISTHFENSVIESIEYNPIVQPVFDIEVEDNHNFLANQLLSSNCYILVDESQNLTFKQMITILTRLGPNSKMVITGDPMQADRSFGLDNNGLPNVLQRLEGTDKVHIQYFTMADIVRNQAIPAILSKLMG